MDLYSYSEGESQENIEHLSNASIIDLNKETKEVAEKVPLPMTLTPFFQDERIIKKVKGTCYLFTVCLSRSPKHEKVGISAINLSSDQEFSVEITPNDLFEKYTKNYFKEFCGDIFRPESRRSTVHELTDQLIQSRAKFINSLLWFKLLVSQAIKESDKEYLSDIYCVDYSEMSTFSKFVRFAPGLQLKGREEAALVLGIGIGGRVEFGIQMPRMLAKEEECEIAGENDYLKEYEHSEIEAIDKYSLPDTSTDAEVLREDAERVKQLERQCEELKLALREIHSAKKH